MRVKWPNCFKVRPEGDVALEPRYRLALAAGTLVILQCAAIGLTPLPSAPIAISFILIGFVLGTMFGSAAIAAAWSAWGPYSWFVRIPLSVLWLVLLLLALSFGWGVPDEDASIAMALCLSGEWLLLQIPFWGLTLGFGLQLQHRDAVSTASKGRFGQFGIAHLMIVTAVVGVIFGIGRLLAPWVVAHFPNSSDMFIFIFLAVAAMTFSLPIILAGFLPRGGLIAVPLVMLLVAGATYWEMPLLHSTVGGGPTIYHLIWINVFTVLTVLIFVLTARVCGYSFALARATSSRSSEVPVENSTQA